MAGEEDDAWDAFGSDSDEDDDQGSDAGGGSKDNNAGEEGTAKTTTTTNKYALTIAQHLSLFFLQQNSQIQLSKRRVGVLTVDSDSIDCSTIIISAIQQREMKAVAEDSSSIDTDGGAFDAVVAISDSVDVAKPFLNRLIPGGMLVIKGKEESSISKSLSDNKNFHDSIRKIYDDDDQFFIVGMVKKTICAHSSICPWLPSIHALTPKEEEIRLQRATIGLSSSEIAESSMSELSIQKAAQAMKTEGFCIIPKLLDAKQCKDWGDTVLQSVHSAAKILLERDQVDIYHPQTSKFEPQSYRELSMREDLRLDLRYGPELSKLRSKENGDKSGEDGGEGNKPLIIRSSRKELSKNGFLRGHSSILEIVRKTMNPKRDDLYKGNIGRYNFDGSGADGSYQDLRVSPVGGIVSFPGAAEQAIHADTPHLFEHIPDLPAHYINIFAPGSKFDPKVGGTAFVSGSHNLGFTAKYASADDDDNTNVYPYLVRPCLELGDVVLFDCRILHFGLANTSSDVERVMLYTNTTQAWFHDPKNWDDEKPIFD